MKGDHIYVRKFPFYTHHGIYIGDPKHEVIHLSGRTRSKKSDAKVRTCTLDEFIDGGQLRLVAYGVSYLTRFIKISGTCHSSDCRTAERVLKTALFYNADPKKWGEYDLSVNNCEHFWYYCKTWKNSSAQVEGTAGLLTSLRYDDDHVTINGDHNYACQVQPIDAHRCTPLHSSGICRRQCCLSTFYTIIDTIVLLL